MDNQASSKKETAATLFPRRIADSEVIKPAIDKAGLQLVSHNEPRRFDFERLWKGGGNPPPSPFGLRRG